MIRSTQCRPAGSESTINPTELCHEPFEENFQQREEKSNIPWWLNKEHHVHKNERTISNELKEHIPNIKLLQWEKKKTTIHAKEEEYIPNISIEERGGKNCTLYSKEEENTRANEGEKFEGRTCWKRNTKHVREEGENNIEEDGKEDGEWDGGRKEEHVKLKYVYQTETKKK